MQQNNVTGRMRTRAIVREMRLDITSGTARTGLHTLIYVVLIGMLLAHELLTITGILDAATRYQQLGAHVRIIVAEGRIDGRTCVALGAEHGGHSAAVRNISTPLRIATMLSVPLVQYAATTSIAQLLNVHTVATENHHTVKAGAFIGQPVIETLGGPATRIATDQGTLDIAGVYPYPDDGRRAGYGFAVILPELVQEAPYDECWLRSWPEHPRSNELLHSTVLPAQSAGGATAEHTQLNTTLGGSFAGASVFEQRLSRFNPLIAVLVSGAIGYLCVHTRRLELASAQHAKASLPDLLRIQLMEQVAWMGCGSCILFLSSVFAILSYAPDALPSLMQITARLLILSVCGALTGVVVTTATVRERKLFTYFTHR